MSNDSIFETFLLLSPQKLVIAVYKKQGFQKVYYKEVLNQDNLDSLNYELIDIFLEKNIFEIEKYLKKFIKNIHLIIKSDEFFKIDFSIKRNNYGEEITKDKLIHLLNEAKDECKKTLEGKRIIHMMVDSYFVNEKDYSIFPQGIKCDVFSVDIRFISLSNTNIKDIEKILKKYQVSIDNILQSDYIESFLKQDQEDFFNTAMKILNGFNKNEVLLVPKETKNKGFFERFFNFFN